MIATGQFLDMLERLEKQGEERYSEKMVPWLSWDDRQARINAYHQALADMKEELEREI